MRQDVEPPAVGFHVDELARRHKAWRRYSLRVFQDVEGQRWTAQVYDSAAERSVHEYVGVNLDDAIGSCVRYVEQKAAELL